MDLREARRQQTLLEVERLKVEVHGWAAHRTALDIDATGYSGRHGSQIGAIHSEVDAAVDRIHSLLAQDAITARSAGDVFHEYALHDQRLVWIRYAWSYFRDKLDQRDDPTLRPILEAADEVTWSAFSIMFRNAGLPVPAAPIPYVEYDFVPGAIRTGQGHLLARKPGVDSGPLREYFQRLPVPLLRLPPGVVTAPWTLALICHEIGHLIQEHLEPNLGFFDTFADLVSSAVAAHVPATDQKRWIAWSQEIFADLCMAVAIGPWGVWALGPWTLGPAALMIQPLDRYPPALTRLSLLGQMSAAAGLPSAEPLFDRLGVSAIDSVNRHLKLPTLRHVEVPTWSVTPQGPATRRGGAAQRAVSL